MELNIFISSTSHDMKDDCRSEAYDVIVNYAGAQAIAMETWNADFRPSVDTCNDKLRNESTHYVGFFGYRRGWVPKLLNAPDKSITELEFDWALDSKKTMAVFLPNPRCQFNVELKNRAEKPTAQSETERTNQKIFLNRVKKLGTVQQFESTGDLGKRILRSVMTWQGKGIRHRAGNSQVDLSKRCTPQDLLQLGRKKQVRDFEDCLDEIRGSQLAPAACFMVQAPGADYGSDEMVARLSSEIEQAAKTEILWITLNINVLWQKQGLENMLITIGNQLEASWEPGSVTDLAERISQLLAEKDVVFKILDIQRYGGSFISFREEFWQPLSRELRPNLPHLLIILLEYEGDVQLTSYDFLYDSSVYDEFQETFDTTSIIVLPALKEFKPKEIKAWLCQYNLSGEKAAILANTLYQETNGKPQALYHKLLKLDLK